MGLFYQRWLAKTTHVPESWDDLEGLLCQNRNFSPLEKLDYGDHGLRSVLSLIQDALKAQRRIALYADYDVDGTMSCVSWIWFFEAIGYTNFTTYIPCRFSEGYGVNLAAVKKLIDEEGAELILTMDTGITANAEAAYCRERGVQFICTDHHKVQLAKMPDCTILNPKMHPDLAYQELCGCGITFVLLRQLGRAYSLPATVWNDLLALTGLATICDVVPLNPVNHRLARQGIQALLRSQRPIFHALKSVCAEGRQLTELDLGFRIGPRINAVGRLYHADAVLKAFTGADPSELVAYMSRCNDERQKIQEKIVTEAESQALSVPAAPILFLGGEWHPGVVGIAASKLVDRFWKPTWLFARKEGLCKGSARSIPGFDVTAAMEAAQELFSAFGGHQAAGGFTFPAEREEAVRTRLITYSLDSQVQQPDLWTSRCMYDCELPADFLSLRLVDLLDDLRPFGHGFEEPRFLISTELLSWTYYNDKGTQKPKHTALTVAGPEGPQKVMCFGQVIEGLEEGVDVQVLVNAQRNFFRGMESLSLIARDLVVGCRAKLV